MIIQDSVTCVRSYEVEVNHLKVIRICQNGTLKTPAIPKHFSPMLKMWILNKALEHYLLFSQNLLPTSVSRCTHHCQLERRKRKDTRKNSWPQNRGICWPLPLQESFATIRKKETSLPVFLVKTTSSFLFIVFIVFITSQSLIAISSLSDRRTVNSREHCWWNGSGLTPYRHFPLRKILSQIFSWKFHSRKLKV